MFYFVLVQINIIQICRCEIAIIRVCGTLLRNLRSGPILLHLLLPIFIRLLFFLIFIYILFVVCVEELNLLPSYRLRIISECNLAVVVVDTVEDFFYSTRNSIKMYLLLFGQEFELCWCGMDYVGLLLALAHMSSRYPLLLSLWHLLNIPALGDIATIHDHLVENWRRR